MIWLAIASLVIVALVAVAAYRHNQNKVDSFISAAEEEAKNLKGKL